MKNIIIIFAFFLCINCFASGSRENILKGNKSYNAAQYDTAIQYYDQYAVTNPESPYTTFNKGLAFFRKEDYVNARKEFQDASSKSKEIKIEAQASYNLGNCAFMQASREADSDLEKAIQFYYESIDFYSRSLELDPKLAEAAYNLEITRLILKNMLDKQKEQQEQNKEQQEKIKKIIEKLVELVKQEEKLIERSTSLNEEKQSKGISATLRTTAGKIKGEQKTTRTSTKGVSGEIQALINESMQGAAPQGTQGQQPTPPPAQDNPLVTAKTHVDRSTNFQELSENNLTNISLDETVTSQTSARDELIKAIEALSKPPEDQQQDQQDQQKEQEEQKMDEQQQAAAEDVIDQEKENKDKRQQQQGGYYAPQKDW